MFISLNKITLKGNVQYDNWWVELHWYMYNIKYSLTISWRVIKQVKHTIGNEQELKTINSPTMNQHLKAVDTIGNYSK